VPTGVWISIDGVEGSGKTTLANAFTLRQTDAVLVAEFSQGPLGRFLADAVKVSPHHISMSPGGQSLVFLGEFWERCDVEIVPRVAEGHIVVHDRGYLSKFAYQYAVMEPPLGSGAMALLKAVFDHLPRPALTIRLTAPMETIAERLVLRDGQCMPDRLEFIHRADEVIREPPIDLGESPLFDTSAVTSEHIAETCKRLLEATREL
jgi:dTMP kinase